jgi:hypothetical protein
LSAERFGRRLRLVVADLVGDRFEIAAERLLAGQQLVEDDAGAEKVRAVIDFEPADLLGDM